MGMPEPVRTGLLPTRENRDGVYLSGFRIVQDSMLTRHAEYRVVIVSQRYERWHRFSELKALARTPSLSGGAVAAATRDSWDAVRACKAPRGRSTLDPKHLSRKCLAIEKFLRLLLEELPAKNLAQLLSYAMAARTPRHRSTVPSGAEDMHKTRLQGMQRSRRENGAYSAPNLQRPARSAGSRLRMW